MHITKEDVLLNRLMITRRKKAHLKPEPIDVMPGIHALIKARADTVTSGWIFPGNSAPCIIKRKSQKNGPSIEQFCNGQHISLRMIQRRWHELMRELGIWEYGKGIHTARHYFITEFYKQTKDLRKTQIAAGHSSSTTTERYAHIVDMQETLAKMTSLL